MLFFLCSTFPVFAMESAPGDAEEKLVEARRMVRISEASRGVIAEELAVLRAAKGTRGAQIVRYEKYLDRITRFRDKQREVLAEMELLYNPQGSHGEAVIVGPNNDARIFTERILRDDESGRLDREFKRSLESFDGELLEKLDELAEEMEEREQDASGASTELAEAIEAAQRRLDQEDSEPQDSAEVEERRMSEEKKGGQLARAGGMAGTLEREPQDEEDGREASRAGEGTKPSVSPAAEVFGADLPGSMEGEPEVDTPPEARDDDIISRQLREAAEQETDPELKKRLWEEYRRYKDSKAW